MTTAAERAENDSRALELRRAGVSPQRIRDELGFRSLRAVDDSIKRAMKAAGVAVDPLSVRDLEMDRLDRLQQAVWLKAVKGDVNAIDRVLALSEKRMRYAGVGTTTGRMRAALAETLAGLVITKQHQMSVAAAEAIADRIDQAFSAGDPMAETKALYLVPHLMNVLRELGVTAAELAPLQGAVPEAPPTNDLTSFKQKRGIA